VSKGDGFFFYSSERNHLWNRFDNILGGIGDYEPLKKTSTKNHTESFIQNKHRKMVFCKQNNLGFVDIFSKIRRKTEGSTDDPSLIPIETIFENGVFDNLIKHQNIKRICCVYTLAYDVLIAHLPKLGYKTTLIANEFTANKTITIVEGFERKFEVVLLYPATRSPHKNELKDMQYKKLIL